MEIFIRPENVLALISNQNVRDNIANLHQDVIKCYLISAIVMRFQIT